MPLKKMKDKKGILTVVVRKRVEARRGNNWGGAVSKCYQKWEGGRVGGAKFTDNG